jgi:hypothetical protein
MNAKIYLVKRNKKIYLLIIIFYKKFKKYKRKSWNEKIIYNIKIIKSNILMIKQKKLEKNIF